MRIRNATTTKLSKDNDDLLNDGEANYNLCNWVSESLYDIDYTIIFLCSCMLWYLQLLIWAFSI